MPAAVRERRYARLPLGVTLDESATPIGADKFTTLQNYVYRRFGAIGKRFGTSGYGSTPAAAATGPVLSGNRWYRGIPSSLAQMIVQCNDALYLGNDTTGAWTSLGSLTSGSTSAFYASCYDPAESGVGGTPASDIMVVAYGSGSPKKWDGTNLTALSAAITNPFAGVEFFHEHMWFWGDPAFPDVVFPTDLANPEAYSFSSAFGGYKVGRGDGDATVQRCISVGNALFAFKTRSIYAFTGFDFWSGEYQFQLQPVVIGNGTPSPKSVARLRNTLIWWSGANFYRMSPGDAEPVPIGGPIQTTMGLVANGNMKLMRAFAGAVLVNLVGGGQRVFTNCYMVAVDIGNGIADTVLVYDEDASALYGKPAWSVFKGWSVGCFIPWGGPGDKQVVYYGDATNGFAYRVGGHATADNGATAVPTVVSTGRADFASPDLEKWFRTAYLETEANAASFEVQVTTDEKASFVALAATTSGAVGGVIGVAHLNVDSFLGGSAGTTYQSVPASFSPSLRGHNATFTVQESSATSAYEIVGLTADYTEEAYTK